MDEKELNERVHAGNKAVEFLNSDIGQFVQRKVNERLIDFTTQLTAVDVSDIAAMTKIQINMKATQAVIGILIEIINESDDADFELSQGKE